MHIKSERRKKKADDESRTRRVRATRTPSTPSPSNSARTRRTNDYDYSGYDGTGYGIFGLSIGDGDESAEGSFEIANLDDDFTGALVDSGAGRSACPSDYGLGREGRPQPRACA